VIVPKYKRSAVDRNQLKRRLREIIRLRLLPVLPAIDVVIRARPEAYGASFAQLEQELTRAIGSLQRVAPRTPPEPPPSGEPASGEPASGEPASGEPAFGEPASGEPASGESASGEPA
jgi:ribonuclease P protein component